MALYKYILCIIIFIIINGRENKVTTAIIRPITCRPRPMLTSRRRLVTFKRLVSVSSRNLNFSSRSGALTSRAHRCRFGIISTCNCQVSRHNVNV